MPDGSTTHRDADWKARRTDVYKRQGYSSPHTAGKQHPSSHTDNVLRGDAPEPVSYTHLDVYKRQE